MQKIVFNQIRKKKRKINRYAKNQQSILYTICASYIIHFEQYSIKTNV